MLEHAVKVRRPAAFADDLDLERDREPLVVEGGGGKAHGLWTGFPEQGHKDTFGRGGKATSVTINGGSRQSTGNWDVYIPFSWNQPVALGW